MASYNHPNDFEGCTFSAPTIAESSWQARAPVQRKKKESPKASGLNRKRDVSRARNGPAFALSCQAGPRRLRLGHGFKNTAFFFCFFYHASRPRDPDCAATSAVAVLGIELGSSNTRDSKSLSTRFASRLMPFAGCETTAPKQNVKRSQITRRTHERIRPYCG